MPIVSLSLGPIVCFVTGSTGPSDTVYVDVIEFNGLNSGIRTFNDGSFGIWYWVDGRIAGGRLSNMMLSVSIVGGNPLLWSVYFILFGRFRRTYDNASIAFWLASCVDNVSESSPVVNGRICSCLWCCDRGSCSINGVHNEMFVGYYSYIVQMERVM